MATRTPQQMRPPPDRDSAPHHRSLSAAPAPWPSAPVTANGGGSAQAHSASTREPGPAPAAGPVAGSHATLSHAELSAKYTNLKKRYFALDDRQKETQNELMRSMERNTKLRSERNILLDRIIELEGRLSLFEQRLQRHDPSFIHANAIRPPSAATGAYPRVLASRAANTAFAANLQRARDELDAEGPRGLERDAREYERDLLARRHAHLPPPTGHLQHGRGGSDVPVSSTGRKRMVEDSWRAEEEEAAALERESKRSRQQAPPSSFSHANSGGDPSAGSPPHPPPPVGFGRPGIGIGSGQQPQYQPSSRHRPLSDPQQLIAPFRQSPMRLPLQLPPFPSRAENGKIGAGGHRSHSNSPRPGPSTLHDTSPPLRHAPGTAPTYARDDYDERRVSGTRSPISPAAETSARAYTMQHRAPPHQTQTSPPLAGARPAFGTKPYSEAVPGRTAEPRTEANNADPRRPNILIPVLPASSNTIAIQAPSPTPFASAPRPSILQRQTKPKRLKAHTVTSKSHSIPTVPRDRASGRPMLPLNVGIMTVLSLGTINPREHFHTERYIFPVGYEVTRRYLSTQDAHTEVVYHCTILDGGDAPRFQIIAQDMPDKPIIAGTATGAWSGIVRAANLIRRRQHSNSVSGPDYFGLGQNTIKHLIQELPGADKLRNYVWQTFVEGGPLGGRHAAVMPALPEDYDVGISPSSSSFATATAAAAAHHTSHGMTNGYGPPAAGAGGGVTEDHARAAESPIYSRSSRSDLDEDDGDEYTEGEGWNRPSYVSHTHSSDLRSRTASHSPHLERIARDDGPGRNGATYGLVRAKWNLRSRSNSTIGRAKATTTTAAAAAVAATRTSEDTPMEDEDEDEVVEVKVKVLPPAKSNSNSNSKRDETPEVSPIESKSAGAVSSGRDAEEGEGEDEEEEDGPRRIHSRHAVPPESEEGVDGQDSVSVSVSVLGGTQPVSAGIPVPPVSATSNRSVKREKEEPARPQKEEEEEEDVEMLDAEGASASVSVSASEGESSSLPVKRRARP